MPGTSGTMPETAAARAATVAPAPVRRVLSRCIPDHAGEQVTVQGWVHTLYRDGGAGDGVLATHVVVRDRAGLVQALLPGRGGPWPDLAREAVVSLTGEVRCHPLALRGVRVVAREVTVLSAPLAEPPLDLTAPELPGDPALLLAHRVPALRHPQLQAVFRLQDEVVAAFRGFLHQRGFVEVRTPKIVPAREDGSGAGPRSFQVEYFGRPARLSEGPQFYQQMMVAAGFERVFEVGPAFRRQDRLTARHLSEFTVLDAEVAFIRDEEDLMDLLERLLGYVFRRLRDRRPEELARFDARLRDGGRIPRLPWREAREILARAYGRAPAGAELTPEEERLLCRHVAAATGSDLLFITRYPAEGRPFFAQPFPGEPALTRTFDLLYRGEEVATGGQRVHDHALLVRNLHRCGLDPAQYAAYLDAFRHGMPPHGGFALGAERLTARLLGLADVRMASAFPQDRDHLPL